MPLTDKAIRHARPGTKPRKMFDGSGLYLELSPNGRKWWRFKYRFGAKDKRISLGTSWRACSRRFRASFKDTSGFDFPRFWVQKMGQLSGFNRKLRVGLMS